MDIFTEIRILEKLQGSGRVSRLYDYGIDEEHFVLVMRHYPASLDAWRGRLPKDPASNMRLFLRIFLAVVQAVKVSPTQKCMNACRQEDWLDTQLKP